MDIFVWPIVVLILGIIIIIVFKKPISDLINRTEKVSKDGLQTRSTQEQKVDVSISKVDETINKYDNQLLVETENIIKNNLDYLKPKDSNEREKYLLRGLAQYTILHSFEKTYFTIWGSQLSALQFLNNNRYNNVSISDMRSFYDSAIKVFPDFYNKITFENWINYLVVSVLVKQNGNDIGITLRGKEFLKFIVEQGYPQTLYG